MKRITIFLISCLALLFALPLGAMDILNQERADDFAPLVQDPALRELLLKSGQPLAQDFNYASLFTADLDILLVGEEHRNSIPSREVNVMLRDLSSSPQGLTHIASEFLLASEQPLLDQFAQGEISYEELYEKCVLSQRTFVATIAKRYGVKVIGLDVPRTQTNYYVWAISPEGMEIRNRAWVKRLVSLRQHNPQARIVLHAGQFHTQTYSRHAPTLPMLLKEENLKTKTLEFVSNSEAEWKLLHLNLEYDTLFIIPPQLQQYIHADYVIYSPNNAFTEQEQAQISAAMDSLDEDTWRSHEKSNACFLDPENPVCRIHIKSGRKK